MKAVVLVGGEGTRLRPLTYDLPKPMVPICGKPFMQYQLELMKDHGIDEVIFSLGYKSSAFEEYFGDGAGFGMKIHYIVEDSPLGTAGAIKNVEHLLDDSSFLVFNGDILSRMNLTEIMNFHKEKKSACTIVLTPVDDPTMYGVVELDSNSGIVNFTEKPKKEEVRSNLINAGLYILEPGILKRMEPARKYSIEREIFPAMLADKEPMFGYSYSGYWMDIGTPFKYLSSNHDTLTGKMPVDLNHREGIVYGKNTDISTNAVLTAPLWIGDNVIIKSGAKIEGPAVIDRGCIIGEKTKISGALLWEKTKTGNGCILDSCLIGRDCNLGDNVKIGKLAVIGSCNIIEKDRIIEAETCI
ncbi:MAG: NDP-sugar synthase [Firmicutes bacterium]|nr:NDP-sugar synthase [Bacillota bacterium]